MLRTSSKTRRFELCTNPAWEAQNAVPDPLADALGSAPDPAGGANDAPPDSCRHSGGRVYLHVPAGTFVPGETKKYHEIGRPCLMKFHLILP